MRLELATVVPVRCPCGRTGWQASARGRDWPKSYHRPQASTGECMKPLPAVRWPRAISQPSALSTSAILHRFPHFYTLRVEIFRTFFIRSRLHMTPMNHEKFHGNRSARFSKIRMTDKQTDAADSFQLMANFISDLFISFQVSTQKSFLLSHQSICFP